MFRQKANWGVGKESKTVLRDSDGQVCVFYFPNEKAEEKSFEPELFSIKSAMPLYAWVLSLLQ